MKTRLAVLAVLLLLIVGVKVPYRYFSPKLEALLVEEATKNKTHLEFGSFNLLFPLKVEAEDVRSYLPTEPIPIPVFCKEMQSNVSLLKLLLLRVANNNLASCYGADIALSTSQGFFSDITSYQLNTTEFKLYEQPILAALGLSGNIKVSATGKLAQTELQNNSLSGSETEGLLEVIDGTYIGEHKIKGLVKLPVVSDLNLKAPFSFDSGLFTMSDISLKSSLLNGQGNLRGKLRNPQELERLKFKAQISLSKSGLKEIGPYLALATGKDADKTKTNWNIVVLIESKNPGARPTFETKLIPAS